MIHQPLDFIALIRNLEKVKKNMMINQEILNAVVQEIKSPPADELEKRLQQSE